MSAIKPQAANNTVTFNNYTFSGTDIKVYAIVDPLAASASMGNVKDIYKELAEISTISYSSYREKEMVKSLSYSSAKGFTRGIRTVAGTMVFTVFHKAVLNEIVKRGVDNNSLDERFIMVDQLPPLDIFITFQNEVGRPSKLMIFGVEFLNEGQVMSVNDLITENSVNFLARHVSPLTSVDSRYPSIEDMVTSYQTNFTSLMQEDYESAYKDISELRQRFM